LFFFILWKILHSKINEIKKVNTCVASFFDVNLVCYMKFEQMCGCLRVCVCVSTIICTTEEIEREREREHKEKNHDILTFNLLHSLVKMLLLLLHERQLE
jgi:hypothetical protein